ncbi:hypothetical protein TNCV_3103921 [Trichonephila clavipes]|nr:hypothetical protein TNCV_3103921 [Trichonephila clavipes]
MYASSSSVNPTPLAHADTPRDILPRGDSTTFNPCLIIRYLPFKVRVLYHVEVESRRERYLSKRRRQWVGVFGSTDNRCHDNRCPSASRYVMVRENTGTIGEVLPLSG